MLNAAQSLLEKLGGERGRWDETLQNLRGEMQSVAGHALLSAGFITYLANMVEAERSRLIASWVQARTLLLD